MRDSHKFNTVKKPVKKRIPKALSDEIVQLPRIKLPNDDYDSS